MMPMLRMSERAVVRAITEFRESFGNTAELEAVAAASGAGHSIRTLCIRKRSLRIYRPVSRAPARAGRAGACRQGFLRAPERQFNVWKGRFADRGAARGPGSDTDPGARRAALPLTPSSGASAPYPQRARLASAAPSESAFSFAQAICG